MLERITEFVKNCHKSQTNKIDRKLSPGFCELLEVDAPFSKVQIDISGPFDMTPRGNKYIVAAIDCFTKFVEMRVIPAQDQYNVGKFILEDIITRHSPPVVIQSDLGGPFISEAVQSIIAVYPPTIQKYRSGYNPQVCGQIERTNASIKEYLRTNLDNKRDWDLLVPACRLSLNTKVNTTTKRSPFELLNNRQPFTFKDIELYVLPKIEKKPNLLNETTKGRYEKEIEKIRKRIREK